MKKLLAILLTLAMLVPMGGVAEETAPQATLTTITFRDFNGRALVAEMEEAEENAYRDLLDALRLEVYRQGFTSWELFLNDQSMVDYGVQSRGADVYISSDVLGGTVYLNLDEDMRHIAEILHQWNASQSIYADAGAELSAKEVSESIAQEYENVGALLAKITKNPLITGEMQSEDIANGLLETDWQQAATRVNKILKVTRVESVSNPPAGCESAKNILYFPLSNEQLMEVLCILLDTVEETPAVKAYVDLLNTYRQLVAFAQDQPVEDTDLQTWLRQQTLLVEDAQVAQYVDSSMRLLRVVVSYKVAPTHTPTLAQDTLLNAAITVTFHPAGDDVRLDWRQETAGKGTNGQLKMEDDGGIAVLITSDDGEQKLYRCTISSLTNEANLLLEMHRTVDGEEKGLSWSASIAPQWVDGEVQQDVAVRLLWQGEHFLTIAAETRPCESRPLLSDGDVLDLGEISSARFNAYMLTLATSISQILPRILMNLPNSVRQLMDGTTTLPSSTIILDNAN